MEFKPKSAKSSPSAQRELGEGDREAVEGASAQTCPRYNRPTMTLRHIPPEMDAAKVARVDALLDQVVAQHAVHLPLAIESGSRAWASRRPTATTTAASSSSAPRISTSRPGPAAT